MGLVHSRNSPLRRVGEMNVSTLLLRQVHPDFVEQVAQSEELKPTSQAFLPSRSTNTLSVYDGDQISAEQAWKHYTGSQQLRSAGVAAVTVEECRARELPVLADGIPYPEHVSIDFSSLKSWSQISRLAKSLKRAANARGWLFRPDFEITAP